MTWLMATPPIVFLKKTLSTISEDRVFKHGNVSSIFPNLEQDVCILTIQSIAQEIQKCYGIDAK